MVIRMSRSGPCFGCGHATVGYVEYHDGRPKPVTVCNRCWPYEVTKEDLPPGTEAAICDREERW